MGQPRVMLVEAPSNTTPSQFVSAGFASFCVFVFGFYSGAFDLGLYRLRLSAIAYLIAIAVALFSGNILKALQSRISAFVVGYTCLLAVGVPASIWRGGSSEIFMHKWIRAVVVFMLAAALINTLSQCRKSMFVIGMAGVTGALITSFQGDTKGGRLVLEGTRWENSNSIAIMLVVGIPMVWLMASSAKGTYFRKVFGWGSLVLILAALLRTGSREGLVGLAVISALAFVRSRMAGRIGIVVSAAALVVAFAVVLPRSLQVRFLTIFQDVSLGEAQSQEEALMLMAASGSKEARLDLLLNALKVTLRNPVLGVGMGQFGPYMAAERARGGAVMAPWSGTHNTYTQVSSEAGLPALFFYLLILFGSMRNLKRLRKRAAKAPGEDAKDIAAMAMALHTSFIAFAICALFNHMGYEMTMPLLAGIAVAMTRVANEELTRIELSGGERPAAPVPVAPASRWAAAGAGFTGLLPF